MNNGLWIIIVLPFLVYYIIYPGGKKRWLKRKKEMANFNDENTVEDFSTSELLDD